MPTPGNNAYPPYPVPSPGYPAPPSIPPRQTVYPNQANNPFSPPPANTGLDMQRGKHIFIKFNILINLLFKFCTQY